MRNFDGFPRGLQEKAQYLAGARFDELFLDGVLGTEGSGR